MSDTTNQPPIGGISSGLKVERRETHVQQADPVREMRYEVRVIDWQNVKLWVDRLTTADKKQGFRSWGQTLFGLGVGLGVLLVPWLQTPDDKQESQIWWMGPLLAAAAACFIVGVAFVLAARKQEDAGTKRATEIHEYMETVESTFPPPRESTA